MRRIRSRARVVVVSKAAPAPPNRLWENTVPEPAAPLLVFFTSRQSGPARRMESLLAHIARKERERLRVKRVDVEELPDVSERFGVSDVPSLVLVKDRRIVARLDGRSTAPQIETMLDAHVRGEPAAA
jgi:thioredoxin 1